LEVYADCLAALIGELHAVRDLEYLFIGAVFHLRPHRHTGYRANRPSRKPDHINGKNEEGNDADHQQPNGQSPPPPMPYRSDQPASCKTDPDAGKNEPAQPRIDDNDRKADAHRDADPDRRRPARSRRCCRRGHFEITYRPN
jgi:hypothetical protein